MKNLSWRQVTVVVVIVTAFIHLLPTLKPTLWPYKTINLGTNVSANHILETAINHKATCIGLSALYTPAIGEMEHVIKAFEAAGIRGEIKVLIGGGATSAQFAEQIGADAYCEDAFQAIGVLKRMDSWSGFAGVAQN